MYTLAAITEAFRGIYDTEAQAADAARRFEGAVWAGDTDTLNDLAPCGCCCYEHTRAGCLARLWDGCRGGSGPDPIEEAASWARHYAAHHGMSTDEFYGLSEPSDLVLEARRARREGEYRGAPKRTARVSSNTPSRNVSR